MFKLDPDPTFWAPVQLTAPGEDQRILVEMEFVYRDTPSIIAWREGIAGKDDVAVVLDMVRNWRKVDKPFSEDAVRLLIERFPASGLEIFDAYLAELTESRVKNSRPPQHTGLAAANQMPAKH